MARPRIPTSKVPPERPSQYEIFQMYRRLLKVYESVYSIGTLWASRAVAHLDTSEFLVGSPNQSRKYGAIPFVDIVDGNCRTRRY